MSRTIVQQSSSSIQGIYGTNPRKKISRLNSPKSEIATEQFKSKVAQASAV